MPVAARFFVYNWVMTESERQLAQVAYDAYREAAGAKPRDVVEGGQGDWWLAAAKAARAVKVPRKRHA